jgi:hypothetical protein
MTRKLEELLQLPPSDTSDEPPPVEEVQHTLAELDDAIDKIDAALPSVRGLDASDAEMDELAATATETFNSLIDLGMNVDSRYAAEIMAVASSMLGHAVTAKTAKLNKKLKMVDLQLKKLKLDRDSDNSEPVETGHGQVLSRNDLLERLIGNRDQKPKTA